MAARPLPSVVPRWGCNRRSWDRLEAASRLLWREHEGVSFSLVDHIGELADSLGCSPRTIRRALHDGGYDHLWECGAKIHRLRFFSAERMECVHRARWRNKGRGKCYETVTGEDRAAYDLLVDVLMRRPLFWEFRPSVYAAREMVRRFLPKSRLPCEKTLRNYAHKAGRRRDASGLSSVVLRREIKRGRRGVARKRGEVPSRLGHTFAERPPEVVNPSTLGHLEGDTVCSPKGRKGVYYSLIDRVSSEQYLIPAENRKERTTLKAMRKFRRVFNGIIRSVTFDRGSEFANWRRIERILGAPVYYADPYNSCQRARNENNHTLVRLQSPKGQPLKCRTWRDCLRLAQFINDYPRRKFGGLSAHEVHLGRKPPPPD